MLFLKLIIRSLKERVFPLSVDEVESRRVALEEYRKWGFNGRNFNGSKNLGKFS